MRKLIVLAVVLALTLTAATPLASAQNTPNPDVEVTSGGGALNPTTERLKQYGFAKARIDQAITDLRGWNGDAIALLKFISAGIAKDVPAKNWNNAGTYIQKSRDALAIVHQNVRNSTVVQKAQTDIGAALINMQHVISGPTPQANINEAAALIEQVHEGAGNRIHHTCDPTDDGTSSSARCRASWLDIENKTLKATQLMHYDVLGYVTWVNHLTVGQVFGNANYWIHVSIGNMHDASDACNCDHSLEHAEYQLGILRDELNSLKSNVSYSGVGATPDEYAQAIYELDQAQEALNDVGAWVIVSVPEEKEAVGILRNIQSARDLLRERGDTHDALTDLDDATELSVALQTVLARDGAPQDVQDDLATVQVHLDAAIKLITG